MAYDGIVTRAVVRELQNNILLGKIEKVYQPEADELVFHIHTKNGNRKLFASAGSAHARLHFIESNPVNPPAPLSFCTSICKAGALPLLSKRIRNVSSKSHWKP